MSGPELHASVNGRARCDGRPLDPKLSSESPECRDMAVCRTCFLLVTHHRREFAASPPAGTRE
jgi:hypothetical protein